MKLVTRWTLAATALERWKHILVGARADPGGYYCKEAAAVEALGASPDPDAVDAILGSTSYEGKLWTDPGKCGECEEEPGELVEVCRVPEGWEGWPASRICARCLLKAMELIEP